MESATPLAVLARWMLGNPDIIGGREANFTIPEPCGCVPAYVVTREAESGDSMAALVRRRELKCSAILEECFDRNGNADPHRPMELSIGVITVVGAEVDSLRNTFSIEDGNIVPVDVRYPDDIDRNAALILRNNGVELGPPPARA
ncbi:MAG TPA: hypothetical protein VLF71_00250 [Candidatus Saccharimonadales bacterium]|nr:hypothetical protein [Candidatus Saccharimonadales bacterium]